MKAEVFKFSIVIPCLNNEDTIEDCLNSILCQTYKNMEILVCDGGSNDSTLKIINKFQKRNLNIVSTEDSGVSNALNIGFNKAKGDIFCWINADDLMVSPDVLNKVSQTFCKKNIDACYGHQIVISEDGEVLRHLIAFRPLRNFLRYGGNIFTGSLFFSKHSWNDFGNFPESLKYAFEYSLYLFIFTQKKVCLCNSFLGKFRIRANSLSMTNNGRMNIEKGIVFLYEPKQSTLKINLARIVALLSQRTLCKTIFYKFFDLYNLTFSKKFNKYLRKDIVH